ncbi:hypothetical protein [Streptomyces iconiensis]|uniref:Uncharacterized protein n=1 Tax=Streptomyces iconiensis TaxID=1384038 RepID=A0ABT7A9C6_9ACTN|nr:hypothetical protein [Streptomyces iconiensis]MDJ1137945.1 hypothetical protein [Streptomyces iconiensis]
MADCIPTEPHWHDCPNRDTDPERRNRCDHCEEHEREQRVAEDWAREPADDPRHAGPYFDM